MWAVHGGMKKTSSMRNSSCFASPLLGEAWSPVFPRELWGGCPSPGPHCLLLCLYLSVPPLGFTRTA